MPHSVNYETKTIWLKGRTFRALGLSSLFMLQAGPVLANGMAASGPGPVAVSPPVFGHHLPPLHSSGAWTQTGAGHNLSLPAQVMHFAPALPTFAATSTPFSLPSQGLNLDLTSSIANIVLGTNLFSGSASNTATVNVGGTKQTFQAGQKVTAAEYVAITEVLGGGSQTLTLSHKGAATGGNINLDQVASLNVSEVVIPKHVTALDYVSTNNSLNFSGDLLNYGSIDGISTNSKVTSGTIAAVDIVNESGGVISTSLPGNLKINNAISDVSLTLSADNNIVNSGQISSAGALTLSAGGAIINANPGPGGNNTIGAKAPSIEATSDLNLSAGSGNFVNAGLLSSSSGNVNFTTPSPQDISINSTGGTVQALAGNINVRDASYTGANNINMIGGNYLSQNLNVYSGTGNITDNIGNVTGNFNSIADSAHVVADSADLKIGDNTINGDPLFVNTGGDIEITGSVDVTGLNQPLTIIATGNVFTTNADTSAQLINHGGDITVLAGANVTSYTGTQTTTSMPPGNAADGTVTVDLSQSSSTGGNINLSNSTQSTIIDTSTTAASANGGNVTLAAYANSVGAGGQIILPSSSAITTSATHGSGGNLSIIAGAASGSAIQVGSITTVSGSNFAGNVSIVSAQPTGNSSTSIIYDSTGFVDGSSTSTAIVASSALQGGNIQVGNISAGSTVNQANVTVQTGGSGNITFTGSANPTAVFINLLAPGGTVTLSQTAGANLVAVSNGDGEGGGGIIMVQAASLVLDANSNTVFSAIGSPGIGGQITVDITGGGLTIGNGSNQASFTTTSGVVGGSVSITASGGNVSVDPSAITVNGGIASGNPSISISGQSITQTGTNALTAANVILTSTGGDIGVSGTPILTATANLTANASGNAFIQNTGTVTLQGASSAGSTSSFILTTKVDGSGNGAIILNNGATITAGTVNLQSNESGGGAGGITQNDQGFQVPTVIAPTISLSDGNGTGGTGSGAIALSTSQGASPLSFNTSTTGPVTIYTSNLTTAVGDIISGGTVNIQGLTGQNLTVNNQGTIESNSPSVGFIFIAGNPGATDQGGSVFVTGGGTMTNSNGANVQINAYTSSDGLSPNVVEFTGSQSIPDFLSINATGVNQAVIVDSVATVNTTFAGGPPQAQVNSPLFINNGTIGGTWIFSTPSNLSGTYASSTSIDLATLPVQTFHGGQLTILSGQNITDSGSSTIDLSNPTGNGGTLYLLAGFNFTPTASIGLDTDNTTSFSITSNCSGNITLPTSTINTSSGSGGTGGNVFAYANGSVNIGTIMTSPGTLAGTGGSVTIIGNGVTVGSITTSGINGGNVTISSAAVALNFSTAHNAITVFDGLVFGGSFQAGVFSGDITIGSGGINASSAGGQSTVNLNASGGGISSPTRGILTGTGGTQVFTAGAGGIGAASAINTDAAFLTAYSGATGNVNITDVNNAGFTIIGANSANNYVVQGIAGKKGAGLYPLTIDATADIVASTVTLSTTSTTTVDTGSAIATNNLTLSTSGILTVASGTLTVNPDGSNNGSLVSVTAASVSSTPGPVLFVANGTGSGNGGAIAVTTTANMTVGGSNSGSISVQAESGPSGEIGGTATLTTAAGLVITTDSSGNVVGTGYGIDISANGANPTGGSVIFNCNTISWFNGLNPPNSTPLIFDLSGVGTGGGGKALVTINSALAVTIGTAAGQIDFNASGGTGGGPGGTMGLSTQGTMIVNTDPVTGNACGPSLGINVGPTGASTSGGSVSLEALSITPAGGSSPIIFQANGVGAGNGGSITVDLTGTAQASIGTGSTNSFEFFANAGPTGGSGGTFGNGGTVNFINGGGITVNPSQITVNSAGVDGAGGTINIMAGQAGSGTLLINGALSASGSGTGIGGSITLVSNSTTTMLIGTAKTTNGTIGNLSVAGGTGGGANGDITVENQGGGLTVSQALTAVNSVDLETGSGGTLTVSNNLGSGNTAQITLSTTLGTATTGKIAVKTLQAGEVDVTTGTQPLTITVETSTLSVTALGAVTVTAAGKTPAPLTIDNITAPGSSAAGAISVSTAGNILTAGDIDGTAVTLKSTGTAGTISTGSGDTIIASTGAISLIAPGGITIGGAVTDNGTKGTATITAAGTGAAITDDANASITAGGAVALTAAKGTISQDVSDTIQSNASTVTLSAANLITSSGTLSGDTAVSVKSTALKIGNAISAGTITSTIGSVTVTSLGNIEVGGVVTAGTTVKESAGTNSSITNDSAISATGSKGAVTLTAAGTNGSITTDSPITVTGPLTLTAINGITTSGAITAGGNIIETVSGSTATVAVNASISSTNGSVILTGAGGIQVSNTVSAGTTVTMTAAGANSAITVGNDITATGLKGTVTLTASGAGGSVTNNAVIQTTGAAKLTAAKGSVADNDAITSNNSAVSLTAGNSIDETGSISAGTTATLKTTLKSPLPPLPANTLSVYNIQTTNGAISVVGAGTTVITLGGTISAGSTLLKPAKATVTIEDSNTTAGNIVIDGGSIIETGGSGGGNVNISIGAPAAPVFGNAPTTTVATYNVNSTQTTLPPTGGPFFFGTKGITLFNTSPADPGRLIFNSLFTAPAKAPQVILSTGKAQPTAITIDAGTDALPTILTADPPSGAIAPISVPLQVHSVVDADGPLSGLVALTLAPAVSQTTALQSTPGLESAITAASSTGLSPTAGLVAPGASALATIVSANTSNLLAASDDAAFVSGRPALGSFDHDQTTSTGSVSVFDWISDTELASGTIPAIVFTGNDLEIKPAVSTVIEMEDVSTVKLVTSSAVDLPKTVAWADDGTTAPLTGAVTENVGTGKAVALHRGSVVFAPSDKTMVHTPFGKVFIDAKSLVLVMAYARGVAIYDLDDRRGGAVKVVSNGKTIVLAPGRSVVLTKDCFQRFEEINPAQALAYRNIRACNLGNGYKAFTGEFSTLSAASAVLPLRQIVHAGQPDAKRITNSFFKTTAIMSQMQGMVPYQRYLRPTLTASAR